MTREEFIDKYQDQTCGLLLAAYASETRSSPLGEDLCAKDGRFFRQQMRRSVRLLGMIYDNDIALLMAKIGQQTQPTQPAKPAGISNGKPPETIKR